MSSQLQTTSGVVNPNCHVWLIYILTFGNDIEDQPCGCLSSLSRVIKKKSALQRGFAIIRQKNKKTLRKGKIGEVRFGTVNVILKKTLQCLSSQLLQRLPVILDVVVCSHINLSHAKLYVLVLVAIVPTVRLATTFAILCLQYF